MASQENNKRRSKVPTLRRQEEYKRESNNPSTEEVLACLQSIKSAALRTGELTTEDRRQVKRRYGCSAVVVKKRFDARGTPTPKRGKKAASVLELADRFELSTLHLLVLLGYLLLGLRWSMGMTQLHEGPPYIILFITRYLLH